MLFLYVLFIVVIYYIFTSYTKIQISEDLGSDLNIFTFVIFNNSTYINILSIHL